LTPTIFLTIRLRVRVKNKVSITEVKNKSGTVSYRVDLGALHGRRQFKQFTTRDLAEAFAYTCNVRIEAKNLSALGDLSEVMVHRHVFMNAYNRLKAVGATVEEATDFFLKYAKPINGKMAIGECIRLWTQEKMRIGCSDKYINSVTRFDFKEFKEEFGENTQLNEVTTDGFNKYLFGKTTWNPVSKMSHIRVISMFFNYALENGWVTRNPIDKASRPKIQDAMAEVLKARQVDTLLRFAEKKEWKDRLTICVLVLFCGCRVEEAVKLRWSDIVWHTHTVRISEKIAKKRRARINEMSENAIEWIYWTRPDDYETNRDLILEGDWKSKLSYLRTESKVQYSQNAMRHSFASYHLMKHQSAERTCLQLGHVGDYKTLFSHYRNLVSKNEANRYFSIIPKVRLRKFVNDKDIIPLQAEASRLR